ncbi:MAG TPA: hypothetical protein VFD63_16310, partial [Pyrinomonadaceae bacterium]|nr:hypothetical protein [Pyrinomonadaceae bacterium]
SSSCRHFETHPTLPRFGTDRSRHLIVFGCGLSRAVKSAQSVDEHFISLSFHTVSEASGTAEESVGGLIGSSGDKKQS